MIADVVAFKRNLLRTTILIFLYFTVVVFHSFLHGIMSLPSVRWRERSVIMKQEAEVNVASFRFRWPVVGVLVDFASVF